jgi:MFS family permease
LSSRRTAEILSGVTNAASSTGKRTPLRELPIDIWALGFGSLFMDASSELIHSLLPIFMVTTLGVSMVTVGFLEGVAEASASVMKIFSGMLSDYIGKRKLLAVSGYALSAMTKPLFPMAGSIGSVFAARFLDRLGKGIRGAPRDALVAEITPAGMRGAAYGLRQGLDSLGALLGPLLAVGCMIWFANNLRAAMWIGVIPAFIAVALLIIYVREPTRAAPTAAAPASPIVFADLRHLPVRFWLVVVLGAIFTLARFSEAFLVLRGESAGLQIGYVPFVMVVMNLFYAGGAYPAGVAADRFKQRTLMLIGLLFLVIADFVLAFAASPLLVFAGASLWGLHMACTQGLFSKLVAETASPALRGSAFGIFHLVSGVALLCASALAGLLWNVHGPRATFLTGAIFAMLCAFGLIFGIAQRPTRATIS